MMDLIRTIQTIDGRLSKGAAEVVSAGGRKTIRSMPYRPRMLRGAGGVELESCRHPVISGNRL